ncbi:MAG: hypothetical protein JOZ71_11820 [Ktedonobacteraceae bacterium]|nr:hypothetical protein [Ktedonobacteraceae bacterium]
MHENEGQFIELRFWFDLDAPCEEDSTDGPFEESHAIDHVDEQGFVDTEKLKGLGYIADLKPIPRLVDLGKKWQEWYERWGGKLFPPMKLIL